MLTNVLGILVKKTKSSSFVLKTKIFKHLKS